MRVFSLFTLFLFIVCFSNAHAAFNGLSHHSRANCVNNESISWDGRAVFRTAYKFNAGVISQHFPREPDGTILWHNWHVVETGAQFDKWRVAAIHKAVLSVPGHAVIGHHWLQSDFLQVRARKTTTVAVDCNAAQGFIRWGSTQ